MKNLLVLSLLITVFFGCKDKEEERLMEMRLALSNDWQVHSIKITEPSKFRSSSTLYDCDKLKKWSFDNTGHFSFKEEAACNPNQYMHAGSWKIENGKYLNINWKEIKYGQPGGKMDFEIEEISADSLQLKQEITIWDDDLQTMVLGVKKFTFIRK